MTALLPQAALTPEPDNDNPNMFRSTNLKGSERDLWRYEFVMIVSQLESRAHLHGRTDCHRRSHPCGFGVFIIVVKRCYCC